MGGSRRVDNDGSEVAVEMILAHRERVIRSGIQLDGGRFSLVDFFLCCVDLGRVDEGREDETRQQRRRELREG